ncbi:MAG: glycosyltransferase family 39 protein [Myxococcota bacterium]|nr:glycosyltransferase family 39 protein [Myxococcota bacterium]
MQTFKDKRLWFIIAIGILLRSLPIMIWGASGCVRDECTYLRLCMYLLRGEGMVAPVGWLWAPGYPFLLAVHKYLFGYAFLIKGTQLICAALVMALLYQMGKSRKVGLYAAALYAFSPSQIFFGQSLWSECIYGALLVFVLYVFDNVVRKKTIRYLLVLGGGIGLCVLFRGVATYMLPIFCFALFFGKKLMRNAPLELFRYNSAVILGFLLVVTPYSVYVSQKFERFIISDRTIGQMMWLGNNDFEPVTFDWGTGQLSKRAFERHTELGRDRCAKRPRTREKAELNRWAMALEDCETQNGVAWIQEHPAEFLQRIPLRIAQLLNPHSFLTRTIRSGKWQGIPEWLDEVLILWGALWSLFVVLGGTAGLILRGRGERARLITLILLYHLCAISLLAGLTRYRIPLEPLLMLYAAQLMEPRTTAIPRWRFFVLILIMVFLVPLSIYFLPTGWSWWRTF